jgi:hypothetical protein
MRIVLDQVLFAITDRDLARDSDASMARAARGR